MRELADEVRSIIGELAANTVPAGKEEHALALARELRALLDGPRRERWYDGLMDGTGIQTSIDDPVSPFLAHGAFRGTENPVAPPLVITDEVRPDGTKVKVGHVTLNLAYEGPPHGVHGGFVAGLFDDILGSAQGYVRDPGVTGRLTVRYRHITPVEEELRFEAWIESDDGKRIVAKSTCHAGGGDLLTAEAEALFIRVDFEEIQARMAARRDP